MPVRSLALRGGGGEPETWPAMISDRILNGRVSAPLDGSDGRRFSPSRIDVRQGSRSQRLGEHRARRERLEVSCVPRSRGSAAIGCQLL